MTGTMVDRLTEGVQIDSEAFASADMHMKKVSLARKTEAKVREIHNECARHIENDNHVALKAFLDKHPDVFVNDIIDSNGKTLLHECTFNDS